MKGLTHAVVGATSGLYLSEKFNISPIYSVGFCVLGSLIVDIDEEHSMINKIIPGSAKTKDFFKVVLGVLLLVQNIYYSTLLKYLALVLIISAISSKVEYRYSFFRGFEKREYHRTIFHDPILGFTILMAPYAVLNTNTKYALAYGVGLFLHYLLDSATTYGLPLYLFGGKRFRLPIHFKSGNILVEGLLMTACLYFIIIK